MDVSVDHSRHQEAPAQVDHLRLGARRRIQFRFRQDAKDSLAFDENVHVGPRRRTRSIDKRRALKQRDAGLGCFIGGGHCGVRDGAAKEQDRGYGACQRAVVASDQPRGDPRVRFDTGLPVVHRVSLQH
ncbi:hypothetical protein [Luteibacter sp. Lutesp34]|uniref:hypothetical protein n=1 Tax=Luteibacter sp. Lutesp34 TaxID=3243030 RepID=UPI0039B669BF